MGIFGGLTGRAEKGLKGRQKRIDAALKAAEGGSIRKGQKVMKKAKKAKR